MILQKPSPKAEVIPNSHLVSLMQISESQKDLNKQIETHKAHQNEIAQGMYNFLGHPTSSGLLYLTWHLARRVACTIC